jgi:hypothetical protein
VNFTFFRYKKSEAFKVSLVAAFVTAVLLWVPTAAQGQLVADGATNVFDGVFTNLNDNLTRDKRNVHVVGTDQWRRADELRISGHWVWTNGAE